MRLISDCDEIAREFGFDPVDQLLAPGIRMDSTKMVTPVLAERDGERLLLAREQESGNLRANGVADDRLRLFERYVSFDNMVNGSTAAVSLAAAVEELAGSGPVVVEGDLPYGRYLQLLDRFGDRLDVEASTSTRPVVLYRVGVQSVLDRFAGLRSGAVDAAKRTVAGRPHLNGMLAELDRLPEDRRFDLLSQVLADHDADAVLCAAPPNVSELTGLAWRADLSAMWARGDEWVYCVAPADDYGVPGEVVGTYPSLDDAVGVVLGSGRLAVEEQCLDTATALALTGAGLHLLSMSSELSLWREQRDSTDLPFMVIAAQASRFCIEGALAYAETALAEGAAVTELDVYRRYLELIPEFRAAHQVPFAVVPFFRNCHAADRTIYPAYPTEHPLTAETKTLKFDTGLKVLVDGVVMGTSDVARSLVRSAEGRKAYDLFTHLIRREIIPRLRPGSVCEDVHRMCVDLLLEHEAELVESGMMPPGVDLHAEYGLRNVGHLMGKQESFETELRPGHTYVLGEGSYGTCEIQWPYRDHSIGSEDLWYIGCDTTYVLSS